MPNKHGYKHTLTLTQWFDGITASDDTANSKLKDKCKAKLTSLNAKDCTIGDLWRLAGWQRGNEKPVNDPNAPTNAKKLTMEDLQQIANAFEVLMNHKDYAGDDGNNKWTYRKENVFSCCACTACCCAVMVLPHARS
jgi:hypothetical protein